MQKFEIKFMGNRMVGTLRRGEHRADRAYSQPQPKKYNILKNYKEL